jgi:hypothetical protein
MENLLHFTLFGSGIAFGILTLVLIVLYFIADYHKNGYLATVWTILFLGITYFWSDFSILPYLTWKNIGGYLLAGFIFSLVRTYFKGRELSSEYSKLTENDFKYHPTVEGYKERNFDLKKNVFRWWFLFPISLLSWVFGHLIKDLYNFIYSKVGRLYTLILNA